MKILDEKKLNTIDIDEGGVLSIHDVSAILPNEDEVEKLAEEWCDKYGESWNAQHSAYMAGMNAIIDAIRLKASKHK